MNQSDIKCFHDDLKAVIAVGAPLDISSSPRIRSKDRLTSEVIDQLQVQSESLLSATETWTPTSKSMPAVPVRYAAAMQVFHRSGSLQPVLDGLSLRFQALQEVTKPLRWVFVYLMIVISIACLGLATFSTWALPALHNFRSDLLLPAAIHNSDRIDLLSWLPTASLILASILALFIFWMLIGGHRIMVLWLGGRHYLRCRSSALAMQVLQTLLDSGMNTEDALPISTQLAGVDATGQQTIQAVMMGSDDRTVAKSLAQYYLTSAQQRLEYMKTVLPVTLIVGIGGSITLLYCILLFLPIVSLWLDLVTAGT